MNEGTLAGLGVLVTRPEPDGEALARRLADAGATVWRLPALDIEPIAPDENVLNRARASLDSGLFVFVSRNAVRFGLPALGGRPARALAVGPSTAEELASADVPVLAESAGYDSESLLRLGLLAEPLDEEIWIVRGDGGRALLGDTLAGRGATVTYLEVYRRSPPDPDPAVLADVLSAWQHGGIGAVTATSVEIVDNLRNLLGSQYADLLSGTPLVTASERVVKRAAETGHRAESIIADAPGDAGLVSALADWHGHLSKRTGNAAMNENKHGRDESGQDEAAAAEDSPPADTTAATADPPESGGGKGLAATALVIALAGAGASAFHWWQGQGLEDAAVSEGARLEGSINRMDSGLRDLENRLTGLERTAADAGRRIDSLQGSVREDLARLSTRDRALETRLATVASRDPAAEPAMGPMLAETEYLLRVAARSVSLAGRPDVAAAALEAADENLAELDDLRLEPVREQIADDLTALSGAEQPDTAGIAMRLGSLANKVDSLPLNPGLAREGTDFGQAVKQPDAASGWDRMVGKVQAFFSDLFRVRAVEGDLRPGLSEDEAFFLYRNLELDLKTARLAALSEDTAGYREALRAARANLERYFDTSDSAVEGALKTLSDLEGVGVETEMPDVSGSLAAFQALNIDDGPGARAGRPVAAPEPGDQAPLPAEPPGPGEGAGGPESDDGADDAPADEAPAAESDSEVPDAGSADPEDAGGTVGEAPESEPLDDASDVGPAGASEQSAGSGPAAEAPAPDGESESGNAGQDEGDSAAPAEDDEPPEDADAGEQVQAVRLSPESGRT